MQLKTPCWNHTGSINAAGYGTIFVKGKNVRAHRVAYALFKGKIPRGKGVCHLCDNPRCINPDHLFVCTQKENMQDAFSKGRMKVPYNPGSRCATAKFTDEQVAMIRARVKGGELRKALAAEYGVHANTISAIVNNRSYREQRG
jgi:hypothetical protein